MTFKETNSPALTPVAVFRSPLPEKFGIPRQAGLAPGLRGQVVLETAFRHPDALRGLDGFDYIWLIWGFNLNNSAEEPQAKRFAAIPLEGAQGVKRADGPAAVRLTVRPPRLGGNERVGVFASRSPFRPNGIGLSSVRVESVDFEKGIINVLGADLADGTPIYDIKPYVTYTDSHPDARSGFVDSKGWERLEVMIPDGLARKLGPELTESLREVLAEDPRPQYQKNSGEKEYGLKFAGLNIRFKVSDGVLTVL